MTQRPGLLLLAVSAVSATLAGCLPEFEPLPMGAGADAAPGELGADSAPGSSDAEPLAPGVDAPPATAGSLAVTFLTTENGGRYAPDNIVAVWIEDSSGRFVKTVGRWAGVRINSLVAWSAASGQDADAVSGATRPSHAPPLSVAWDARDKLGNLVPDGTYTIRMELADRNAGSADQNHQGTFTFVKGAAPSTQNVAGGGFLNVAIAYTAP